MSYDLDKELERALGRPPKHKKPHGRPRALIVSMIIVGLLMLLATLAGCAEFTPYVSARHTSNPTIDGDGLDVICAGAKYRSRLSVKAGYCGNVRGGDILEVEIEYELRRRKP